MIRQHQEEHHITLKLGHWLIFHWSILQREDCTHNKTTMWVGTGGWGRAPRRSEWKGCVWVVFLLCWVRERSQVWRPFITCWLYCRSLLRPLQKTGRRVNQPPEWQAHHLCLLEDGRWGCTEGCVWLKCTRIHTHIHIFLKHGGWAEAFKRSAGVSHFLTTGSANTKPPKSHILMGGRHFTLRQSKDSYLEYFSIEYYCTHAQWEFCVVFCKITPGGNNLGIMCTCMNVKSKIAKQPKYPLLYVVQNKPSSIMWGRSYLTSPSIGGKRVHSRLQTEGMVAFVTHVTHQHFSVLSWVPTKRERQLYEMRQQRGLTYRINCKKQRRILCTVVTWMITVVLFLFSELWSLRGLLIKMLFT